jgi:hypothetical protein
VIQHTALSPQDADDDAEIVAPPAPVSDGRDTVNRSRGQRRHTSNSTTVDTPPTKKKMRQSDSGDGVSSNNQVDGLEETADDAAPPVSGCWTQSDAIDRSRVQRKRQLSSNRKSKAKARSAIHNANTSSSDQLGSGNDTLSGRGELVSYSSLDNLGGDGDGGLLFSNVALSISPSASHIAAKAKPVRARSTHRRADAVGAASTNHRDLSTDALGGVRCIEPLSGAARCDVSATKVLDRPPLTRKPRAHRFGSH